MLQRKLNQCQKYQNLKLEIRKMVFEIVTSIPIMTAT
jgi:hypothetical protein